MIRFEAYYDDYMKQWTVRDIRTLEMYPVTSENMANEFARLFNVNFENSEKIKELILDGVVDMHDGKIDCAEKLLNEAYELI